MWKILTKQEAIEYIQTLKEDVILDITQKQKQKLRTYAMVKYYWAVVVDIIADFHWYHPVECNEMLKTLFKVTTFTDLSTKEFKFVIESIIDMWSTKYWVNIPTPINSQMEKSLFESLWF